MGWVPVDPHQSRSAPNAVVLSQFLGRSALPPIGLSMSYFATNSSTEPIAVDLLLQFMTFRVYRPTLQHADFFLQLQLLLTEYNCSPCLTFIG